jgi:hypothetical protein
VGPSAEIRQRFNLSDAHQAYDILIRDRRNCQGVELLGEAEKIWELIQFLRQHLLDAVIIGFESCQTNESLSCACLEFPGASKESLDRIRSTVTPTLSKHHRFRVTHSKGLDKMETDLLEHPEKRENLEQEAFMEEILYPLQKTERIILEHVKPCGKPIPPRKGHLFHADTNHFVMKRFFSCKGQYDGLEVPLEKGDYGLTEVHEGMWHVKHAYYSKDGRLKGEYYNINTPVEFYPYGGRYLDLEIDVVRRAGEKPFLVDQKKFAILAREGIIGPALKEKALEVTEGLMRQLTAE